MARLKYGQVYGKATTQEVGIAASEVFAQAGGGFFKFNASGLAEASAAADASIAGWLEVNFGDADRMSGGEYTSSSTAGLDKGTAYLANDEAEFRIPADATPALTDTALACDIVLSGNVQQADIGAQVKQVLVISRVTPDDIANQTVVVRVNARQAR